MSCFKLNIVSILFLTPLFSFGQITGSRLLVRNAGIVHGKQTISLKWYSTDLLYPEGVNIYRKEENEQWKKINVKPIKKLDSLPKTEYFKDNDLNFFVPAINDGLEENLNGLFMINILIKSFQSESFSRFLGIQFEDTTVTTGKTYLYKVNRIKGSVEIMLGEMLEIKAGSETIEAPVRNINIKGDTNKVSIKWMVEDQRFYAVNIYRLTPTEEWMKVNPVPVMISKYKDSLGRYQYPSVFYSDDSLDYGIYTYQIAGVDFFGRETTHSQSIVVELKDIIPPPMPELLKDSINNLTVLLSWKNSPSLEVTGINIYRSIRSDEPFTKVNSALLSSTVSSYSDIVPKAGLYYYFVASVDAAGNEGKSHTILLEVNDIVPPHKPIDVTINADTGKMILRWKPNIETDLAGYRIYRTINTNDQHHFVLLNTYMVTSTTFTDILPKNAKNDFLYKIIAIDSAYNKSDPSDIIQAKMPDIIPTVKPYIKNISAIENTFLITWLPNEDTDIAGYELYRSEPDGDFRKITTDIIKSPAQQYIDTDIIPLLKYRYYLLAVDSAGNRSQPSEIWIVQNNNISEKGPVDVKLSYKPKTKSITISWSYESTDTFIGYVIYRKSNTTENMHAVSGRITETDFTDNSISEGNTYYYEIRVYVQPGVIIHSDVKKITL